jgi:hypothetical protein
MGNDDEKKPRIRRDIDPSRIKNQGSERMDKPVDPPALLPMHADLMGTLDFLDEADSVDIYKEALKRAPGFPWAQIESTNKKPLVLLAPYLTGVNVDKVTVEQLIEGIYINIPRSKNLWKGDQLRIVWGYNTFYTTLEGSPQRDEPRLVQYMNSEQLADYQSGVVNVHYEVVRRSRLVGISETLKVTLHGKRRPGAKPPRRSVRKKDS